MNDGMTTRSEDAQRGSVTVFVTLMLPILALMIFLVVNIGQLVFEKIRLQNTADACALSAAAVQAAGLNEIAELNFWSTTYVINLVRTVMAMTSASPWQSQSTADSAVNFYKSVFEAIRDYQDKANEDYAKSALDIAKAVKKANLDKRGIKGVTIESINPRASFNKPKNLIEYKTTKESVSYTVMAATAVPPFCILYTTTSWNDGSAGDKKHIGAYLGWSISSACVAVISTGTAKFDYKISKKSKPMTYSAFKLTQEAKDFVIAGSVFGRMDKMTAYAAAMPTGGNIENGSPNYKAVLVRLSKLDPKPDVDLDKVLH